MFKRGTGRSRICAEIAEDIAGRFLHSIVRPLREVPVLSDHPTKWQNGPITCEYFVWHTSDQPGFVIDRYCNHVYVFTSAGVGWVHMTDVAMI